MLKWGLQFTVQIVQLTNYLLPPYLYGTLSVSTAWDGTSIFHLCALSPSGPDPECRMSACSGEYSFNDLLDSNESVHWYFRSRCG